MAVNCVTGEVTRMADGIQIKALNAWFGASHIIRDIDLTIAPVAVTAIIGPSGCGKSTFVRCLNRMHEVVPDARGSGYVLLEREDLYGPDADARPVRRRAARVSQATGCFLLGELVEFGVTHELFTSPRDKRTEDYITGRFG